MECTEDHCQSNRIVELPSGWPTSVEYFSSSLCMCLRREISIEHWKKIHSFRHLWHADNTLVLRQKSKGEIKTIPPSHPAYVKGISESGYFASIKMDEGEFIGEFTGKWKYRKNTDPSRYLSKVFLNEQDFDFQLDVDAEFQGNETRFINSSSPDCSLVENARMETVWSGGFLCIFVYATRVIKAGEEILLNYGSDYFEEETHPLCRRFHIYARIPMDSKYCRCYSASEIYIAIKNQNPQQNSNFNLLEDCNKCEQKKRNWKETSDSKNDHSRLFTGTVPISHLQNGVSRRLTRNESKKTKLNHFN